MLSVGAAPRDGWMLAGVSAIVRHQEKVINVKLERPLIFCMMLSLPIDVSEAPHILS